MKSPVTIETMAISHIEDTHMVHKRIGVYVPLDEEELNWNWDIRDVKEFDRSFNAGMNIFELAEKFNRCIDEVAILILDRGRKGKLKGVRDFASGNNVVND